MLVFYVQVLCKELCDLIDSLVSTELHLDKTKRKHDEKAMDLYTVDTLNGTYCMSGWEPLLTFQFILDSLK